MNQKTLFDAEASAARKETGKAIAAENQVSALELARTIAVKLCEKYGETDADQVGRALYEKCGITSLGPAAGSIFSDGRFVFTGRRLRSTRKKNHAREIKVWRLKNTVTTT